MAREGEHNAQLKIQGDAKSADKELQALVNRVKQLEQSVEKNNAALARMTKGQKQTEESGKSMGVVIQGISDRFSLAKTAVLSVADAFDRVSQRSLQLQAVQSALTISINEARAASLGLVDDMTLMVSANNAVRLGVVKNGTEFAKLVAIATKLSLSTGQDASKGVEDLTLALARQSPMILDNLGISLKLSDAYDAYAATLGKTSGELTEAQKKQAFVTEALRKGEEAAGAFNLKIDDGALTLQRWKVDLQNFADSAAVGFTSALASMSDALGTFLIDLHRADESAMLDRMAGRGEITAGSAAASQRRVAVRGLGGLSGKVGEDARLRTEATRRQNEEALALIATMEKQNAETRISNEMFAHNAMVLDMTTAAIEKNRKSRRGARQESVRFGEVFEFTPEARREMQGGGLSSQVEGESDLSLRDSQEKRIEAFIDFEQRKLEVENEANLQRIAMREDLGLLEPIDALELEREAQFEHLEHMRRFAADDIEQQRITNQQRQINHESHLKRLEIERKAELRKWRTTSEIASATAQITQGGIQTASMATDMFIVNEQRREKARYVAGGVSALVTGIEQQVQAIAAFASFNYVQGALHQAAAIFAFAQSGMLFAKAGGAGQVSGVGGSVGGASASAGASAGATGAANGRPGGEGLQNQIQSDVPPSQAPTSRGPTNSQQQQSGGNIQFNGPVHLYGTPQGEFVDSLARSLALRDRNQRRAI